MFLDIFRFTAYIYHWIILECNYKHPFWAWETRVELNLSSQSHTHPPLPHTYQYRLGKTSSAVATRGGSRGVSIPTFNRRATWYDFVSKNLFVGKMMPRLWQLILLQRYFPTGKCQNLKVCLPKAVFQTLLNSLIISFLQVYFYSVNTPFIIVIRHENILTVSYEYGSIHETWILLLFMIFRACLLANQNF